MADNYLERKMEELRRGGQSPRPQRRSEKGSLLYRFPPRRVLIVVGEGSERLLSLAEADRIAGSYLRHGSRAALLGYGIRETPDVMEIGAAGEGKRLLEAAELREEFSRLYDSWRGLDILIGEESPLLRQTERLWAEKRAGLPVATFYTPRTLLLHRGGISSRLHEEKEADPESSLRIDRLLYLSREESRDIREMKFGEGAD